MRVAVKWTYWWAARGIPERKEHKDENKSHFPEHNCASLEICRLWSRTGCKAGWKLWLRLCSFSVTSFWNWKSDHSSLTEVIPVQHLRPDSCHGTDLLAPSYLTASRPEKYGRDRLFCPFTFWQTEASCKGGPLQVKGSVAMEEQDHNKTIIIINLWSSSSCLLPGHGSDVVSCLHWPAEDLTSSLLCKTSQSSLTKNAECL